MPTIVCTIFGLGARARPVGEHQVGHGGHLRAAGLRVAAQRRKRARCLSQRQLRAVPGSARDLRHLCDQLVRSGAQLHVRAAGAPNIGAQALLRGAEVLDEGPRIALKVQAPAHDERPALQVRLARNVHTQPKAIDQLRAQRTLLRVHGAHQAKTRVHSRGEALALHQDPARRRGVKSQVRDVLVEEVHLVDVEDAAVSRREQARREHRRALLQGPLEVQAADHAILGHPQRQREHPALRQVPRQRAGHRRLGRPLFPTNEHAAYRGIHGGQHQGQAHIVLADDRRKREKGSSAHWYRPYSVTKLSRLCPAAFSK